MKTLLSQPNKNSELEATAGNSMKGAARQRARKAAAGAGRLKQFRLEPFWRRQGGECGGPVVRDDGLILKAGMITKQAKEVFIAASK